jgi:hypothetical protein
MELLDFCAFSIKCLPPYRRGDALRVPKMILARSCGISCDLSATPAGKVIPEGTWVGCRARFFRRIYVALPMR